MDKNPLVGVVILNYKVKEATLVCLRSVQKSDYKKLVIVVVDNNSGDGLKEEMKGMSGVEFIQSGANLGYSGGNNLGIGRALKKGAEAVLVLNPDTEVDSHAISFMVNVLNELRVGVVGGKVLFDDKKTIWYAGGELDLANVLGSHRGVDEVDKGQYDQKDETDFVTGAAIMVKRQVLDQVGLFDERYFLYYEDSDLCLRVKQAGFKVMYQPKAVIFHANAKSTGLGSPTQDYFITRNRLVFAFKFLSWRTRIALLREGFRNFLVPTRRQALIDFLLGNLGKGSFAK